MPYQLVFSKPFDKAFGKLDASLKARVNKLFEKIRENPKAGKPLHGRWDFFSVRFEGFRMLYTVNEKDQTILLVDIGKRDTVYR